MRRLLTVVVVLVLAGGAFYLGQHYSTSSTTTSSTANSTTTNPSTSTTGALATNCRPQDFRGVFNQGQGAAGTIFASVTITKTSAGSCTIKGWPLITLQDKLGAVLPTRAINVPTNKDGFSFPTAAADAMPQALALSQGSIADFSIAYSDVPTGSTSCPSAVTISVQFLPKSAAVTVTALYPLTVCNNGSIWVSPFY